MEMAKRMIPRVLHFMFQINEQTANLDVPTLVNAFWVKEKVSQGLKVLN